MNELKYVFLLFFPVLLRNNLHILLYNFKVKYILNAYIISDKEDSNYGCASHVRYPCPKENEQLY